MDLTNIDFTTLVRNDYDTICNFGTGKFISEVTANVLCNLVLSEILNVAESNKLQKPHFVVAEEIGRFGGPQFESWLVRGRAHKVSVLALQNDPSSFTTEKMDLWPKAVSQAGLQISFQQKNPEDVDKLAKGFALPNLDLTPLLQEIDRHDGYEIVEIPEISESASMQKSLTRGEQLSATWNESRQRGIAATSGRSDSFGFTHGTADGNTVQVTAGRSSAQTIGGSATETEGQTDSDGNSRGRNSGESRQFLDDETRLTKSDNQSDSGYSSHSLNSSQSRGRTWNDNEGESSSLTSGQSKTQSRSSNRNFGQSTSQSESINAGFSHGGSYGHSLQHGSSAGRSATIHHKRVPLAKHKRDIQPTGRLLHSTNDQFMCVASLLTRLAPQFCLLRNGHKLSQLVRIDDVAKAFDGRPILEQEAVEWFKNFIYSNHGFYLPADPQLSCPKPKGATNRFKTEDRESSNGPTTP